MNRNGQSMIEVAVFFMVLAPLIGLLLGFTRWFQIREKLLMGAWLGAELYSSGQIAPAESRQRVLEYLTTGMPALAPSGIVLRMGRAPSRMPLLDHFDQIQITYTPPQPWLERLGLPQTLEETCFIKHAPHYWDPITADLPIPGQPTLSGPVYRW